MKNSNYGGHTVEDGDYLHGYVDDAEAANAAIKALEKQEQKKHAAYRPINRGEPRNTNYAGFSFDEGDPFNGYVERGEEVQDALREYGEQLIPPIESKEPRVEDEAERGIETAFIEPMVDSQPTNQEPTDQEKRLNRVFEEGKEMRERRPDRATGLRLMSVASVKLEKVEQPDDPEERIKVNNAKLKEAAKKAVGEAEFDEYSGDTVAGVSLYVIEALIGSDSDYVAIGDTETLVSSNGQIGRDPETYKNLVVIRWRKNGMNHVFAFSPRRDARMYALVDDSTGGSWRDSFVRAGAMGGKDRKNLIIVNHERHDDGYHHEKTLEKVVMGIIRKETELLESEDFIPENKGKTLMAIGDTYRHIAHLPIKTLESKSPDEAKEAKKDLQNQANETAI